MFKKIIKKTPARFFVMKNKIEEKAQTLGMDSISMPIKSFLSLFIDWSSFYGMPTCMDSCAYLLLDV